MRISERFSLQVDLKDIEGDLRKTIATLEQRVADLEAKLVERDVYEAQQILPPEQAALIKHLATVERCIEEGPREAHYADDSECHFCGCREGGGHEKTCAWLALQFDRKPAETMALVEGWAWDENDRRDRVRAAAMAPRRRFSEIWPPERVYGNLQNDLGRIRVETSPFVPPGTAYLTNLSAFERGAEIHRGIQARLEAEATRVAPDYADLERRALLQPGAGLESEIALRLKMDEINGTGLYPKPDLGIPDTAVAPPDDEDVP